MSDEVILDTPAPLADIQSSQDLRGVKIEQVGISEVKLPMIVKDRDNGSQQVTATIKISASLEASERGTHMSRFVILLEEYKRKPLDLRQLEALLSDTVDRLGCESSFLDVGFHYFREKAAPATGESALLGYECSMGGICTNVDGKKSFKKMIRVKVPVMTLCPCSKKISDFGAHNQRTIVTAAVGLSDHIWLEELIDTVEAEGSVSVYPLLKRPDEKYVTEKSYMNPKFVEDVVRDIHVKLDKDERVLASRIECESLESIHAHNAFAQITSVDFPREWQQ